MFFSALHAALWLVCMVLAAWLLLHWPAAQATVFCAMLVLGARQLMRRARHHDRP